MLLFIFAYDLFIVNMKILNFFYNFFVWVSRGLILQVLLLPIFVIQFFRSWNYCKYITKHNVLNSVLAYYLLLIQ
jgi:hypothetical protein